MNFKAVPNPMRHDDCFFVVHDVEPQPYRQSNGSPVRGLDGELHMQLPRAVIPVGLPADLAFLFAAAPRLLGSTQALLKFARSVRPGGGVMMGEAEMLEDAEQAILAATRSKEGAYVPTGPQGSDENKPDSDLQQRLATWRRLLREIEDCGTKPARCWSCKKTMHVPVDVDASGIPTECYRCSDKRKPLSAAKDGAYVQAGSTPADREALQMRLGLMHKALRDVLIAAEVLGADADPSGLVLLSIAESFIAALAKASEDEDALVNAVEDHIRRERFMHGTPTERLVGLEQAVTAAKGGA